MITNNNITYYHKTTDETLKLTTWTRYKFYGVWAFSRKGANVNQGYENSNNVEVRIPMELVEDTSIFTAGDIIAMGEQGTIEKQSDLNGKEFYNVTSIAINDFGNNPHIHLGGR